MGLLERTLAAARQPADTLGFHVHYAVKANFNDRLLGRIRDMGFGADCVSGNEVRKAIETGFDPGKIVFAGVGKSRSEEHTSELQSLMRISYAVFCLKKKNRKHVETQNKNNKTKQVK